MRGGDTMFYPFLANMWFTRQITEAQLRAYVPFYITQIQCDLILATPQMTEAQVASMMATV